MTWLRPLKGQRAEYSITSYGNLLRLMVPTTEL